MIATITRFYIRHYSDSGQTVAYCEWVDGRGRAGRTEGNPAGWHMRALAARAKHEELKIEEERW